MKKVLITGCSGYIGTHLVELINNDYEVHGLDIKSPRINIPNFYYLDINNLPKLKIYYDCVIHLAALVKVNESVSTPFNYYKTNLFGTHNVLENISTKNFIFASTGNAVQCSNPYGVSKKAAEDCVREYCEKNIDYTIFRFYNVVGSTIADPTNPDGLFFNLINAEKTKSFTIYGNDYNTRDGTCLRDYIHVNEICESIKYAIKKPSNNIEHLGHGIGHTVQEMAELYKKVNNVDFEIKYGPRRQGDLESSVLDKPSTYLKKLYSLEQLLRRDL